MELLFIKTNVKYLFLFESKIHKEFGKSPLGDRYKIITNILRLGVSTASISMFLFLSWISHLFKKKIVIKMYETKREKLLSQKNSVAENDPYNHIFLFLPEKPLSQSNGTDLEATQTFFHIFVLISFL